MITPLFLLYPIREKTNPITIKTILRVARRYDSEKFGLYI
jgi:hypothetical protein